MSARDPVKVRSGGIRPSLWILATVFFLGAGFAIHAAFDHDAVESSRRAAAEASARRSSERELAARTDRTRASDRPGFGGGGGGAYRHHDWSQESELNRRMALGLPQPGFWDRPPSADDYVRDPQLIAMWRSFHIMRGSDTEDPPLPFEPTAHHAQLVDAEGDVSASPTSCDVRVLPVASGQFNCVVRVMCDGSVLYPNPSQNAGYVPCEIENGRPVRAVDDGQTNRDGDPLVDLDLANGTITVEDFAPDGQRLYRATLRINS